MIRYLESIETAFWELLLHYQREDPPWDLGDLLELSDEILEPLLFGVFKQGDNGAVQLRSIETIIKKRNIHRIRLMACGYCAFPFVGCDV